jgi:hypothetical protein
MTVRLALPVLGLLFLTPLARADRFHFGSAEDAAKVSEGHDVVVGVLLKEEDDNYVIRVEGGEVTVAKSAVHKIEKDGLTVADLEKREQDSRDRLAAANRQRNELVAAEAAARASEREAAAVEAAMTREPAAVEVVPQAGYDPILGRYVDYGAADVVRGYVQSELGGVIRRHVLRELRDLRRELRAEVR